MSDAVAVAAPSPSRALVLASPRRAPPRTPDEKVAVAQDRGWLHRDARMHGWVDGVDHASHFCRADAVLLRDACVLDDPEFPDRDRAPSQRRRRVEDAALRLLAELENTPDAVAPPAERAEPDAEAPEVSPATTADPPPDTRNFPDEPAVAVAGDPKVVGTNAHDDDVAGTGAALVPLPAPAPSAVVSAGGSGHVARRRGMKGWLDKMAVGRSVFGARNWKRRWVRLTEAGLLSYHESDAPGAEARGPRIDVGRATLITNPSAADHPAVEGGDDTYYLLLSFREAANHGEDESATTARALLLRADSAAAHRAWCAALRDFAPHSR